jgi:hypothetical protein
MSESQTFLKYPNIARDPKKCFDSQERCQQSCQLPAAITSNIMLLAGPSVNWQSTMQSPQQQGQAFLVTRKPIPIEEKERKEVLASQKEKVMAKETYYANLLRAVQLGNKRSRYYDRKLQQQPALNQFEIRELNELETNPIYWDQSASEPRDTMYILQQYQHIRSGLSVQKIYDIIARLIVQNRGAGAYEYLIRKSIDALLQSEIAVEITVDLRNSFRRIIELILVYAKDLWKKENVQAAFWHGIRWNSELSEQDFADIKRLIPFFFPVSEGRQTNWADTNFHLTEANILDAESNYFVQLKADATAGLAIGRTAARFDIDTELELLFTKFTKEAETNQQIVLLWLNTLAENLPIENVFSIISVLIRPRVAHNRWFPIMPVIVWVQTLAKRIGFGSPSLQRLIDLLRSNMSKRPCFPQVNLRSETKQAFIDYTAEQQDDPDYFINRIAFEIYNYHWCRLAAIMSDMEREHESAKEAAQERQEPRKTTRYDKLFQIPAGAIEQMQSRRLDQEQKARALRELNLAEAVPASAAASASSIVRPAAAAASEAIAVVVRPAAAAAAALFGNDENRKGGCRIISNTF